MLSSACLRCVVVLTVLERQSRRIGNAARDCRLVSSSVGVLTRCWSGDACSGWMIEIDRSSGLGPQPRAAPVEQGNAVVLRCAKGGVIGCARLARQSCRSVANRPDADQRLPSTRRSSAMIGSHSVGGTIAERVGFTTLIGAPVGNLCRVLLVPWLGRNDRRVDLVVAPDVIGQRMIGSALGTRHRSCMVWTGL